MSNADFRARIELGRAIARMYVAAQGVNMWASDAACQAMEEADDWMRWGFNAEMRNSPYNVKAYPLAHPLNPVELNNAIHN